jgi:hypothetical protein
VWRVTKKMAKQLLCSHFLLSGYSLQVLIALSLRCIGVGFTAILTQTVKYSYFSVAFAIQTVTISF